MVVGVVKTVVTVRVVEEASVAEVVAAASAAVVDASNLFMSEVVLTALACDAAVVDGVLRTVVIAGQTAGA